MKSCLYPSSYFVSVLKNTVSFVALTTTFGLKGEETKSGIDNNWINNGEDTNPKLQEVLTVQRVDPVHTRVQGGNGADDI